MKVLVVYDSMYGNTEQIAKAIGSACKASVLQIIGTRNKIHILHRNDKRAPPAMIN